MAEETIGVSLSDDKQVLVMELAGQTLRFSATELESFIAFLGDHRLLMHPEVPKVLPAALGYKTLAGPGWNCEPDTASGQSLVHWQDGRYGWLHYRLPKDQAKQLGETLIAQAENGYSAPTQGKAH